MDLKQYIEDATSTESRIDEVKVDPALLATTIQIMIASGSILDQIKKNVFYDREFDNEKLTQHFMSMVDALDGMKGVLVNGQNIDVAAFDPRIFHAIVGLSTETTELLEALVEPEFDKVNFLEELGDVNWYQAIGIDAVDGDFEHILNTNIAKLKKRYPGKFDKNAANKRDVDAETEILNDLVDVTTSDGC